MIEQFFDLLKKEIDSEKETDQIKRDEKADVIQKKWLHTPQKELDGQTPYQAIEQERKRRGNFNPIHYSISITPFAHSFLKETADKAKELFEKALEKSERGDYLEGIKLYEAYLTRYGEHFQVWGNLGVLYLHVMDMKKARECFHRALSLKPDYSFAKNNLAAIEGKSQRQLEKMAQKNRIISTTIK